MNDKKVTIEDVPCYECLCLAMCKNKTILILEEECPHIKKYYASSPTGIVDGIDFRKWTLLLKALYKDTTYS